VIPIHYAISILQQKGIAWHAASEDAGNSTRSESQGQASTAPAPLSLVPAPFPSQSFFGGEVVLDALVDRSGGVSDVRVTHGEDPFVDKALAAVRTWMFTPARSGGQAVESRITIAFEFPQPYIPPRSATVHHYSDDASQWTVGDTAPAPTSTTEPAYPDPSAKPGSVILYGSVDKTGQLGSIQVVRGAEPLTQAALAAAQGWKFEPAMQQGNTVDSAVVIAVSFRQPLVISRPR
jgi:TonB family protein